MNKNWYFENPTMEKTSPVKMKFLNGYLLCTGNRGFKRFFSAQLCGTMEFNGAPIDAATTVIFNPPMDYSQQVGELIHGYLVEREGNCYLYKDDDMIATFVADSSDKELIHVERNGKTAWDITVKNYGIITDSIFEKITSPFAQLQGLSWLTATVFYTMDRFDKIAKDWNIKESLNIEGLQYVPNNDGNLFFNTYSCNKLSLHGNPVSKIGINRLENELIAEYPDGKVTWNSLLSDGKTEEYTEEYESHGLVRVIKRNNKTAFKIHSWYDATFDKGLFEIVCNGKGICPFIAVSETTQDEAIKKEPDIREKPTDISMDINTPQIDNIGVLHAEHTTENCIYNCSVLTICGITVQNVAQVNNNRFLVQDLNGYVKMIDSNYGNCLLRYSVLPFNKSFEKDATIKKIVSIYQPSPSMEAEVKTVTYITKGEFDTWNETVFNELSNSYAATTIWHLNDDVKKFATPQQITEAFVGIIHAVKLSNDDYSKCKTLTVGDMPVKRAIKGNNHILFESMDGYYFLSDINAYENVGNFEISYQDDYCNDVYENEAVVKCIKKINPKENNLLDVFFAIITKDDNGKWRKDVWDVLVNRYTPNPSTDNIFCIG